MTTFFALTDIYNKLKVIFMQRKGNKIRLTEQELNMIIDKSVRSIVNEGKFSNALGKFGKNLTNAALATAMTVTPVAIGAEMDRQSDDSIKRARQEVGMDNRSIASYNNFLRQNELPDNGESLDMYYASMKESRMNNRISKIVRESLKRFVNEEI
jgi:hypothetical protein